MKLFQAQAKAYWLLASLSIAWWVLWHFWCKDLLYTFLLPIGMFIDIREIEWFGLMIAAIVSAIWYIKSKNKTVPQALIPTIFLLLWILPSLLTHFHLMSWQGLYDYEWVQRVHLLPFNGKIPVFVTRLIFPAGCNFDSWRNILLLIPIGILIAGIQKKGIWLGIAAGSSLLIEPLQLITRIGCCDIDDAIYRLMGLFLGFGVGCLVSRKSQKTT